jgi:hypothetical protein
VVIWVSFNGLGELLDSGWVVLGRELFISNLLELLG